MLRAVSTGTVLALAALLLAGCGVRGPLEPPAGSAAVEAPPPAAPTARPSKPFVLDGLL